MSTPRHHRGCQSLEDPSKLEDTNHGKGKQMHTAITQSFSVHSPPFFYNATLAVELCIPAAGATALRLSLLRRASQSSRQQK
ncbi:hypothetical protein ACO22_08086 [Paracoccidioides brasiliensis]|uniref:Uncharacterized protein n=1 Tax=Paracoccidioides brasiliensis TaxID=121759 RepID=A0A1D2J2U7_PARBR|nr:hypothetical protein ACO22_08086 [Paracoccidioides brasiliensis]